MRNSENNSWPSFYTTVCNMYYTIYNIQQVQYMHTAQYVCISTVQGSKETSLEEKLNKFNIKDYLKGSMKNISNTKNINYVG